MKAQSAIEYLFTYGWMLIAVSIVSAAVLQTIPSECRMQTQGISNSDINIEDEAVTSQEKLAFAIRSDSPEGIIVRNIQIETDENNVSQDAWREISPGDAERYDVAEVNRTETGCVDAQVTINYDMGSLKDMQSSGTLTMPATLVEAIKYILQIGGGSIYELEVQSSVMISEAAIDDAVCIGNKCEITQGEEERPINRSGDEMTGTLRVNELSFECLGDQCVPETGVMDGSVSDQNNTMDGTLNVTEIYREESLCLGSC